MTSRDESKTNASRGGGGLFPPGAGRGSGRGGRDPEMPKTQQEVSSSVFMADRAPEHSTGQLLRRYSLFTMHV